MRIMCIYKIPPTSYHTAYIVYIVYIAYIVYTVSVYDTIHLHIVYF